MLKNLHNKISSLSIKNTCERWVQKIILKTFLIIFQKCCFFQILKCANQTYSFEQHTQRPFFRRRLYVIVLTWPLFIMGLNVYRDQYDQLVTGKRGWGGGGGEIGRVQELCESLCGRPGLPVPDSP